MLVCVCVCVLFLHTRLFAILITSFKRLYTFFFFEGAILGMANVRLTFLRSVVVVSIFCILWLYLVWESEVPEESRAEDVEKANREGKATLC